MYKLLAVLVLLSSCSSPSKKEKRKYFIEGKWLVLYPDHDHMEPGLKEYYGKIQDSIVGLTGLKLLGFNSDGKFYQLDSIVRPGQWKIVSGTNKEIIIENGGLGFSPFTAELWEAGDSVVVMAEAVKHNGRSFPLEWNLKRVSDKDAAFLFAEKANKWRIRPVAAESPAQIKERLAYMLAYYSSYFFLVQRESSYFVSSRVLMPLKFYQHAIGLKPLSEGDSFQNFFYDQAQAEEAYSYLETTMGSLRNSFPSGRKNYVEEYAIFLGLMSDEIARNIKE